MVWQAIQSLVQPLLSLLVVVVPVGKDSKLIAQQRVRWADGVALLKQLFCQRKIVHALVLHAHPQERQMQAREQPGSCAVGCHCLQACIGALRVLFTLSCQ